VFNLCDIFQACNPGMKWDLLVLSYDRNMILKHCNKISYTGCPLTLLHSLFPKLFLVRNVRLFLSGYGSVDVYGSSCSAHASAGMSC